MARVDDTGTVRTEVGDILPREIAVKTDDPPEIVKFIQALNETKFSQSNFETAVQLVDDLRREYHNKNNADLAE